MARGGKFASHKYGGMALRYELGLDILQGNLICIDEGPYAAGKYPDITFFLGSKRVHGGRQRVCPGGTRVCKVSKQCNFEERQPGNDLESVGET